MGKADYFKYIGFTLLLIALLLPQKDDYWIWAIVVAGALIIFWIFKNFGTVESWKYVSILLILPLLIIDTTSKLFIWLSIFVAVGFIIWILKKWVFK